MRLVIKAKKERLSTQLSHLSVRSPESLLAAVKLQIRNRLGHVVQYKTCFLKNGKKIIQIWSKSTY